MKTIWKYKLQPMCLIEMPIGAEVLSVLTQDEEICLWALVNPDAKLEIRRFVCFGTGHFIPDKKFNFLGTAHLQGGSLVFHVFEDLSSEIHSRT